MSRLDKAPRGLPGPLGLAPVLVDPAGQSHDGLRPFQTPPVESPEPTAATEPPPSVKLRKQGGYYAHDADVQRAQAAWKHTELLEGGYPSWSAFQVAAVMRLTEELEREHNDGRPFPPLPPGRRAR